MMRVGTVVSWLLVAAAVTIIPTATLTCADPPPCNPEIHVGDRLALTILHENRNDDAGQNCGALIGLSAGTTVIATMVETYEVQQADCIGLRAKLEAPNIVFGPQLGGGPNDPIGGGGSYVFNGGCQGAFGFQLALDHGATFPIDATSMSASNLLTLSIGLDPTPDAGDAACTSGYCGTTYVVDVTKL